MAAGRQDCSICMDSFKNPKLISCHHSFCCKCLEDYVRVNLHNGRFNCPICRASVELPEGGVSALQSNFYIDTDAGDKFACDICGPKNVACSRCLDCEENLCQSCCYVHEKSKGTRHHKICDLGTIDSETKGKIRQRIFCDQHPEDEIRLFCRDCQALICFMCKVVKHEIHVTEPVPDAAAEMKKTLETKVNECSDKLRRVEASKKKGEELDKIITDAEQEELNAVDEQGSQLCKAIVQELEKVKTRIKNVYHDLRQRNADFTRDVEEEFKTCSNARDNAQTLTYQGTDIDIIKKGPDVKELISAAISKTEQTSDMRLENKLFSPVEIKHGDLISLLGTMEDSTEEEGKKKEREERTKQEREEKEKHEREEKQIKEWSNGMEARVKALEEELSNTRKQYEKTKADANTKGLKLTQAEKEIQALRNQHADYVVQVEREKKEREQSGLATRESKEEIWKSIPQYFASKSHEVRVCHETGILCYDTLDPSIPVGQFIASKPLTKENNKCSITILAPGSRKAISIGLVPQDYGPDQHPGWVPFSIGYHADDGMIYKGRGMSTLHTETCDLGDVMEVEIDVDRNIGWFRKNGRQMTKFDINFDQIVLYPCIGLQSKGEAVRLNEKHVWTAENKADLTQIPPEFRTYKYNNLWISPSTRISLTKLGKSYSGWLMIHNPKHDPIGYKVTVGKNVHVKLGQLKHKEQFVDFINISNDKKLQQIHEATVEWFSLELGKGYRDKDRDKSLGVKDEKCRHILKVELFDVSQGFTEVLPRMKCPECGLLSGFYKNCNCDRT